MTLLRLQGTLMQGLLQHAASGGAGAAHGAMSQSVSQMQGHFSACVREAQALLGLLGAAAGGGNRGTQQAGRNWDRMLLLGQLGLTGLDMARLQLLRRQQAARVIQRAVRAWLKRRRHVKQVEAARRQAQQIAQKLRAAAATIIQKHWRRWVAQRRAKWLRRERLEGQRHARLQALVQQLAVLRIQRAWRAHRKRVRAAKALAVSSCSAALRSCSVLQEGGVGSAVESAPAAAAGAGSSAANTLKVKGCAGQDAHVVQEAAASCLTSQSVGQTASSSLSDSQAGSQSQRPARAAGFQIAAPRTALRAPQDAAATRIQAVVRGWLLRKSDALWWSHCMSEVRSRRAAARAWASHHAFMAATYSMQEQLVALVLQEAEEGERAMREVAAERQEFEASWGAWLRQQCTAALSQQLPKGWLPHQHPDTGEVCFLDTRTGGLRG